MKGWLEAGKERKIEIGEKKMKEDGDLLFSGFVSPVGPAQLQSDESMGRALILDVTLSNDLRRACALSHK